MTTSGCCRREILCVPNTEYVVNVEVMIQQPPQMILLFIIVETTMTTMATSNNY
jgi:hypothetical protein